ncbi:type II secretion system F family protein [Nocardioides sp.]|uniref:type II secretion system F family protein n=1 Tax=Nocardioides sp. TaxID=35761 RepID=UPI002721A452|nr:type II secretion system F family protein [Nocardioides sp.]MDO9458445.1 type II secretion system F family protein [Nocardioides sp.]
MVLVFVLGVVLVLFAIGLVSMAFRDDETKVGVTRSLAVLEAMTTAPAELKEELERPFDERVLKPLQARLLAIGRRLTGADTSDRLQRKLDYAGNPRDWTADRVVSVKVLGAIALLMVGFALALVMGVSAPVLVLMTAGGLVLGFFLPDFYLYQTAYNRSEQLARELPDAVDLLTISVESGLGFDAACQQVSRNTEGPLSEEFARMLAEMQIGQTRSAALRGMSDRCNVPDVKTFVGAMVQADAFGIPIGGVLRVQSSEMRVKRRQRAETKAQQVPVKITVPLIFCILPCLFVAVMGPAALQIVDNIGGR